MVCHSCFYRCVRALCAVACLPLVASRHHNVPVAYASGEGSLPDDRFNDDGINDDDDFADDGDELDDEDFVPPERDDPRYWDDFGADFEEDEPEPAPGDFWTADDEQNEHCRAATRLPLQSPAPDEARLATASHLEPGSALKKGDCLQADRFLSGENAQCEVPVPLFQQTASRPQRTPAGRHARTGGSFDYA